MRRLRMVSIVLVALLVAGWVVLGRLAPRLVAGRLARATGLDVSVGRVGIDWRGGRLRLGDVVARAPDGVRLLRADSVEVGVGAVRGGQPLVLDGAIARRLSVADLPVRDGRARRLRLAAAGGAVLLDGVVEQGNTVIAISDGRLDPAARTMAAERVAVAGIVLVELPDDWPVATRRFVVTDAFVGGLTIDRLVADEVVPGALPARLRGRVRMGDGTARVRWNAAAPRLDVRLVDFPLRTLAGDAFGEGTLSGGLTSGAVRVGRVPGVLEARIRMGPTRLARGGETWIGWGGLAARVAGFDLRSRRLLGGDLALTEPVVMVRRAAAGVWPAAGWHEWLKPDRALALASTLAALAEPFKQTTAAEGPPGSSTLAVAGGTLTLVDATIDPPARLAIRDLDARAQYDPAGLEGHLEGVVGEEGTVAAALAREPLPRVTLAVRGLPIVALGGWGTFGSEVFGIPLGRALALAGADPALDVDVDVTGDATEKRFGLATKALESLVATLRDRVTTPLLASAEMRREDDVETLVLPVVPVDPDATALVGEAADVADRLAAFLVQFPELSVRLDGRFAPDEPAALAEARAAAIERHLAALGLADRVVLGPVEAGPPGVAVVVGGRVS